MSTLSRRRLLQASALLGLGAVVPGRARASVARSDLKFLFVNIYGGWDPAALFAPAFDNPLVHLDDKAFPATAGNIAYVGHPDRPSVRAFLDAWHDRTLLWNGISVPSVGHLECQSLVMTGDSTRTLPDWATILAAEAQDRYPVPHVVVSGPQYNGTFASLVTRVGTSGYTKEVLDGSLLARSDLPVSGMSLDTEAKVDAFVRSRIQMRQSAATDDRKRALLEGWLAASDRADTLQGLADDVPWNTDGTFASQVALAVELLRLDLSRVVSFENEAIHNWDTHVDNDAGQSVAFEDLFSTLGALMETLTKAQGSHGGSLADEVVIVLQSEMGRTPQLNEVDGKDHWGTTSAMLIGPGFVGDRVVGAFGDYFYGDPIDFASGELSDSGQVVTGGDYGSTLLAIGDVDPDAYLPQRRAVDGVIG